MKKSGRPFGRRFNIFAGMLRFRQSQTHLGQRLADPAEIFFTGFAQRKPQRAYLPAQRPRAVFTGMGLTSQNMASQKSFSASWSVPAWAKSLSRHSFTSVCISAGRILATTEITPLPPRAQMGTVSSSLPDQMKKSSGQRFRVRWMAPRLPEASLTPLMLGCFASSA